VRIRRGLGTRDQKEAEKLVAQLNVVLGDRDFWTPTAKAKAEAMFDEKVVNAFYDNFLPATQDAWALRDQVIPLPGRKKGYAHARFLGTTGAGKTTLVRQLIGADPEKERFPSTSTAKTTVCDIEIVLTGGPFKTVVTFFPREHVRLHIDECVLAAAAAVVFEKGGTATAASRLLEHSEQRFRLSYLLGKIQTKEKELSDDDEPENEVPSSEGVEVSEEERGIMSRQLEGYVKRIERLATDGAEKLAKDLGVRLNRTEGEDENAFQELFEDELKQREGFHALVDEIMDAVEERFELLDLTGYQRDRNDWPLLWQFETTDRPHFIKTVNRFSSNHAGNFGRLLTPLVQGIRVRGEFAPAWNKNGECKLVLLDGEGLGHTPDSSASISTSITQRLKDVDAVVLVDNAEQPMQAAPQALVRTLAASGNERKLMVCFTHFDQVKGPNLPNITTRKEHVFRSLENAISSIREVLGRSAENALRRETASKTFFLSNIQNPIKETNRLTITELQRLVDTIRDSIKPRPPAKVMPVYDMSNLILAIPQAMNAFRDPWRGRLRLPTRSTKSPEHWTRIKALSRRFAELGSTEYDTLRPVADFIACLIEHVTVVLSNPLRWDPENAPEEMKRQVIADISGAVYGKLHELGETRLFHERVKEWSIAYSHRGTGSARDRAMDIEGIYGVAAPIPGEATDPHSTALVASIKAFVQEAVEGAGGTFE
jgi:energy-coupling factor transporter ATP-binding protein EcfA2